MTWRPTSKQSLLCVQTVLIKVAKVVGLRVDGPIFFGKTWPCSLLSSGVQEQL